MKGVYLEEEADTLSGCAATQQDPDGLDWGEEPHEAQQGQM